MVAVTTHILPPRYRDPFRIARGGMGEIYRATDELLGREVAVKLLGDRYAEDEAVRNRFKREALAAARLSGNPNIITIFDVGDWNGRPFIVMEYLSGGSLETRIREDGAAEPSQALEWLEQAARALDAAHEEGIVHRDVKPANLLLDRDSNIHVADFGIASAAGLHSLTATGTVLGTAGYLSPEQARGDRATAASDRYALAVVAFELLTGERPYAADSIAAEASAHVHAPIPSVSARRADLPPQIDAVFRRALAKDPDARYPCGTDFVAALRQALHEAAERTITIAPPPTAVTVPAAQAPPPAQPHRRRTPNLALAVIALALLAGGAALATALAQGDDGERAAAPPPPRVKTLVRTVTAEGRERKVTVTVTPTAQNPGTGAVAGATSPARAGQPAGSLAEAIRLNDQGYALMNQGRYAEALQVSRRALARLQGTGHIYEAYANYNVGRSLIELGNCAQGMQHIERSERLQGHRSEFDVARAKCP